MDEHTKWHTCKRRSQIIASPAPPPPTPMHSREVDRQSRTGLILLYTKHSVRNMFVSSTSNVVCELPTVFDYFLLNGI